MKIAQFIIGMVNGVISSYESPDLPQMLPASKLSMLWELDKLGTHSFIDYDERVIAKAHITPAKPDEHGRNGIINHTVLCKFDLYTEQNNIFYVFNPEQFEKSYKAGRLDFPMPNMPMLQNPLPTPEVILP